MSCVLSDTKPLIRLWFPLCFAHELLMPFLSNKYVQNSNSSVIFFVLHVFEILKQMIVNCINCIAFKSTINII